MVLFFGFGKNMRTFFPTLKPLNILDRALFVVCFVPNTSLLLFCGILTCNCISCAYLVGVYTVNTPRTPYCLFLTTENVPLTFGVVFWSWKHQPYLCSYFQSSKCVVFLLLNILFRLFWGILTLNCISRKYLVAIYTVNTTR